MPFTELDQSVASARPVYYYEIRGPIEALRYFYTSYHEDRLDILGNDWEAIVITSTAPKTQRAHSSHELVLELGASQAAAVQYAMRVAPMSVRLLIYKQQLFPSSSYTRQIWDGIITTSSVEGDVVRFRSTTQFASLLVREVPGAYYQSYCNNVLYDPNCGVARTSFDQAATVVAITAASKIVEVSTLGGSPTNWFKGGEMVRDSDGERRLIVANQTTGGQHYVHLNRLFRDLDPTDAITMYAGCDHSIGTCRDKFSNAVNHRGFPYISGKNLFRWGFRGV